MDTSGSDPIYISGRVLEENKAEHCSFEDKKREDWQELEKYWDEEKIRIQDFDGEIKTKSNSLEELLLRDDFVAEPFPDKASKEMLGKVGALKTVRGKEIRDIPTSYILSGFEPHEFIAIGTYVDKNIIPGFCYKVRKNLTNEYLFNGEAVVLETVSPGFGKRITFKGDSLNQNDNYFWSDSRIHGFGFTLQTLHEDKSLTIVDSTTGQELGRVVVNNPSLSTDIELSTDVQDGGRVEKQVRLSFSCDIVLSDVSSRQNVFMENEVVEGVAFVVRVNTHATAKLEVITLKKFALDGCHLLPED